MRRACPCSDGVDPVIAGGNHLPRSASPGNSSLVAAHGHQLRRQAAGCRYNAGVGEAAAVFGPRVAAEVVRAAGCALCRSAAPPARADSSAAGFKGCGQVCRSTSVSISKRRSTLAPAGELPASKLIAPSSATHTLLNQLTLAARSRRPEPVLAALHQEGVVTVLRPLVAVLLIALFAPAGARPAPCRNCRKPCRASRPCPRRSSRRSGPCRNTGNGPGQLEGVLALQRVGRVVALQRVLRVVEQHADIGAALRSMSRSRGAAAHASTTNACRLR